MPIRVADLRQQKVRAEIHYFEESGSVLYRPGAITEEMFERVQEAAKAEDENALNGMLAELLIEWDVMGDDGKPVPFTPEGLRPLPIPFKSAVLTQVIEDAQGNLKTSSVSSGAGSRSKGR